MIWVGYGTVMYRDDLMIQKIRSILVPPASTTTAFLRPGQPSERRYRVPHGTRQGGEPPGKSWCSESRMPTRKRALLELRPFEGKTSGTRVSGSYDQGA